MYCSECTRTQTTILLGSDCFGIEIGYNMMGIKLFESVRMFIDDRRRFFLFTSGPNLVGLDQNDSKKIKILKKMLMAHFWRIFPIWVQCIN